MRRRSSILICLAIILMAQEASADFTAFLGVNQSPSTRRVRGVALSISLLFVGFEFEYSDTVEDTSTNAPSLRSGMFNIQLQTPSTGGLQFYGTAGGGLYQENLMDHRETNIGTNAGGGIKLAIVGPIGVRIDYRIFKLNGNPVHNSPQRVYVGFNLPF